MVVVVVRIGLESLSDMVASSPFLTLTLDRLLRFTACTLFALVLLATTSAEAALDLGGLALLLLVSGPLLPESIFSWGSTFLLDRFLLPEEAVFFLLSQPEEDFFRFVGGLWLSEFDDRVRFLPVTFLSGLLTELLFLWCDSCLKGLVSQYFSPSTLSR